MCLTAVGDDRIGTAVAIPRPAWGAQFKSGIGERGGNADQSGALAVRIGDASTFTGPAGLAGAVAVMVVLFVTTTFVAALVLKMTVAPVKKLEPESETDVPPLVEPTEGEAEMRAGGGL